MRYETRCCASCGKIVGIVPQGTTVFCSGECYEKWRDLQTKLAIRLFKRRRGVKHNILKIIKAERR